MLFYGKNNQKVGITILNYEFPPTAFGYDKEIANDWLEIKISIESNFGNYSHTSSIFLVNEIENLIYWLNCLSQNNNVEEYFRSIEEYFEFKLVNSYKDKEKRIKIKFKEEKGSYVEFLANNKLLRKYAKELSSELKFLFDTYKSIIKLYKIITRKVENIEYYKIISENHIVRIKENFKEGYRNESGYKILYSKNFIRDLKSIEKNKEAIETIEIEINDIKTFPFKFTNKWTSYDISHGVQFKIAGKYAIFYMAFRHELIKFVRIIKINNYYRNYLEYDFRDYGLEGK
jgi:hypothetical protein